MSSPVTHLHRRLRSSRLHRPALAGAWLFVLISLAHLAWVMVIKTPDPAGTVKLYHTVVGDQSYDAWGLTYDGAAGLARAVGQALVVLAALAFTCPPLRGSDRLRRAGHVVLLVWSAWWAANVVWLAGLDHRPDSIVQAALLTAMFACTVHRAACGWSRPGRPSLEPIEVPVEPLPSAGPPPEADDGIDEIVADTIDAAAIVAPPTSLLGRARALLGLLTGSCRRLCRRRVEAAPRARARAADAWRTGREKLGPAARAAGRRAESTRRRVVQWLRDSAVIPEKGHSPSGVSRPGEAGPAS
ncbi:MAG: hypothetical protein ACYTG1_09790 [Planctomycetota bacterium]|jgi:hypothetical protein